MERHAFVIKPNGSRTKPTATCARCGKQRQNRKYHLPEIVIAAAAEPKKLRKPPYPDCEDCLQNFLMVESYECATHEPTIPPPADAVKAYAGFYGMPQPEDILPSIY